MGGAIHLEDPMSFEALFKTEPEYPAWKKIVEILLKTEAGSKTVAPSIDVRTSLEPSSKDQSSNLIGQDANISVETIPFRPKSLAGNTQFTKMEAHEIGLDNPLSFHLKICGPIGPQTR